MNSRRRTTIEKEVLEVTKQRYAHLQQQPALINVTVVSTAVSSIDDVDKKGG